MTIDVSSWLPNLLPVLIKVAGTAQTARRYVNFVGVTAADDSANDQCTITVSGGTTPTGTGIPHIVGGVQNAASSLIVNADVNAAAAIALSKLSGAGAWANLFATMTVAGAGVHSDMAITGDAFITHIRFTFAGLSTLDGMVAGGSRFVIVSAPDVAGSLLYADEAGSVSAAANKFKTTATLSGAIHAAVFFYDTTMQRWVVVGRTF